MVPDRAPAPPLRQRSGGRRGRAGDAVAPAFGKRDLPLLHASNNTNICL